MWSKSLSVRSNAGISFFETLTEQPPTIDGRTRANDHSDFASVCLARLFARCAVRPGGSVRDRFLVLSAGTAQAVVQ